MYFENNNIWLRGSSGKFLRPKGNDRQIKYATPIPVAAPQILHKDYYPRFDFTNAICKGLIRNRFLFAFYEI